VSELMPGSGPLDARAVAKTGSTGSLHGELRVPYTGENISVLIELGGGSGG
jgi:hypothetical protein